MLDGLTRKRCLKGRYVEVDHFVQVTTGIAKAGCGVTGSGAKSGSYQDADKLLIPWARVR